MTKNLHTTTKPCHRTPDAALSSQKKAKVAISPSRIRCLVHRRFPEWLLNEARTVVSDLAAEQTEVLQQVLHVALHLHDLSLALADDLVLVRLAVVLVLRLYTQWRFRLLQVIAR